MGIEHNLHRTVENFDHLYQNHLNQEIQLNVSTKSLPVHPHVLNARKLINYFVLFHPSLATLMEIQEEQHRLV